MYISRPPRQDEAEERTIFFAGLSEDADEEDIKGFLQEYQGLEEVRLIKDRQGSRGIAYIQFRSVEDKQAAWESLLEAKLCVKGRKFTMREW